MGLYKGSPHSRALWKTAFPGFPGCTTLKTQSWQSQGQGYMSGPTWGVTAGLHGDFPPHTWKTCGHPGSHHSGASCPLEFGGIGSTFLILKRQNSSTETNTCSASSVQLSAFIKVLLSHACARTHVHTRAQACTFHDQSKGGTSSGGFQPVFEEEWT